MSKDENIQILEMKDSRIKLKISKETFEGFYYSGKNFVDLHLPFGNFRIPLEMKKSRNSQKSHHEEGLQAPMPGKIIKIFVKAGDQVKKGDLLLILEAMKMEHQVMTPQDGTIQKILFKEGERVSQGEELVELRK